jgi:5-methylthioadenosine/S-adenosylhomocysteine deaminase
VAGEAVMRNGQLTRVDEGALLREINSAYELLGAEFDLADESVAPLRAEMEKVYARAQALQADWQPHMAKLAVQSH